MIDVTSEPIRQCGQCGQPITGTAHWTAGDWAHQNCSHQPHKYSEATVYFSDTRNAPLWVEHDPYQDGEVRIRTIEGILTLDRGQAEALYNTLGTVMAAQREFDSRINDPDEDEEEDDVHPFEYLRRDVPR